MKKAPWKSKNGRAISDAERNRTASAGCYPGAHQYFLQQLSAALYHSRERGRWQIHAHWTFAVRLQGPLRRPDCRGAEERYQSLQWPHGSFAVYRRIAG